METMNTILSLIGLQLKYLVLTYQTGFGHAGEQKYIINPVYLAYLTNKRSK